MRTHRDTSGLTLIELLVVVVVIGILAAIAIPKFNFTQRRGFRAAAISDLKNLASLQELYHSNYFSYTTSLSDVKLTESANVTVTITEADASGWAATATHDGLAAGEQCGMFIGSASASNAPPATEAGAPVCNF